MDLKRKTLFSGYLDVNFEKVNKSLHQQYYLYMIVLLGFTVLFLSVILRFDYLQLNPKNMGLIAFILCPVIYLVYKSLKGLILLNDHYQYYHFHVIRQFLLLYIWAYNLIISSIQNNFFSNGVIYLIECLCIYVFIYIFSQICEFRNRKKIELDQKRFYEGNYFNINKYMPIKEMSIFACIILVFIVLTYQFLSPSLPLSKSYYFISYLFMMFISFVFLIDQYNEPYAKLELDLLNKGLKNCPHELIKSYKLM